MSNPIYRIINNCFCIPQQLFVLVYFHFFGIAVGQVLYRRNQNVETCRKSFIDLNSAPPEISSVE